MENIILIIFYSIIAALGIGFIILAYYYSLLVEKNNKLQKQNIYLKYHVQEKSLQKINLAKDKSLNIIADAAARAEEILRQAEAVKNESGEHASRALAELITKQQEALRKANADLTAAFSEAVRQVEQQDIGMFKDAAAQMENITGQEIRNFEKQLLSNTVGQQGVVEQKIQESFLKAQAEIAEFKKDKFTELEIKVRNLLPEITRELIGKRLTYEDQRDLIKTSLERAKIEILEK